MLPEFYMGPEEHVKNRNYHFSVKTLTVSFTGPWKQELFKYLSLPYSLAPFPCFYFHLLDESVGETKPGIVRSSGAQ